MRSVGRGAFAPPLLPPPHVPYGSRWSFERRTRTHTGSGVGFYRDQLDLLRADQFLWDPYPPEAYAALPQHSGILSGAWRASVPLICFDIVEVHLPERVLRQFGMVQGIPPPCDTEAELHHSRKGQEPKNWLEVNWRHVARWEHRLELLAQGASIDAAGAPTTADYIPWFLSITRRWMTPRGIMAASQYTPAAPTMTHFAQGIASVISSSQEEPVWEIAQGILRGTQFQQFIPELTAPDTTMYECGSSSHHADDVHLEEVDLTCPDYGAGSSQGATSSHYQSPPLPERHATASYYRRRRRKPLQLDKVQEED
ncbi:serine/threonine-protein phosphatase 7 long form homolog [Amaranthus tricolor]|uniref:serine/threonine-protein phosphatase 7 long form homolog n=1 Tax=Amaranthus tricolor TaxID=29722 RepID=UPI0025873630|nr:serine/threonine-protein phosphatase 7 long form homolog [Amaranthus tricolor]